MNNQYYEYYNKKLRDFVNAGKTTSFESFYQHCISDLEIDSNDEAFKNDMNKWFSNITNFNFLLDDDILEDIEEIIFHGNSHIQLFPNSGKTISQKWNNDDFQLSLDYLCLKFKQNWNYSNLFKSFFITLNSYKFRATLIHYSITANMRSKLVLRKISENIFSFKQFKISKCVDSFLNDIVLDQKNIIISGATGSGKTSFTKSMLNLVKKDEHIIVLEDTHELKIDHPNTSYLLSENVPNKTLNDYCSYAMRMRPDRIVLGEIRSQEVIPLTMAMNTGHKGIISTVHANSAVDTLNRLCLLFQIYHHKSGITFSEIMKLLTNGIDYIIFMENKEIKEIIKIIGCEGNTPYYQTFDLN